MRCRLLLARCVDYQNSFLHHSPRAYLHHREEVAVVNQRSFLVVDDDAPVRLVLRRAVLLVDPQAYVIEAATVSEALHALHNVVITAVVTDFHLPDGTAIDILQESRRADPQRRVLVLSGVAMGKHAALQAGADQFLVKPVALPHLLSALRQLH